MSNAKNTRSTVGYYLLILSMFAFFSVAGANVYELITEVPNWSSNVPESLIARRANITVTNPGHFFQTFSPLAILCLIASTILLRNRPKEANKWLLISLGGIVIAEAFTGIYFMPRNFTLFLDPMDGVPVEALRAAASEWVAANKVRLALVLITWFVLLKAYAVVAIARHREVGQ
ncbi:MAG TPA: hypothetical protein PL002_05590 [Flavobacteriales bacterium]|jgi:hypothetical protein|nr:hypothetical protein [Flavobacteriales bacterium]HNK40639.1 hypothetical protein [Flavobacteriales bacterium]HRT54041.1 hypothetical protein [Flavobacteriales bacterium]